MKILVLIIFLIFHSTLYSQIPSDVSLDISAVVFLDSFVVTASKKGFDVADFIEIVQKDESFFRAFHNLRFQPHFANNTVEIFDKKRTVKAANYHRVEQQMEGNCRTMRYLSEEIKGNFYKRKKQRKHRYYTAKMHEQVFLTKGKVCGEPENPTISNDNLSGIQKHINELKKLIFQPGREVDVPFIGGKTAIFKQKMLRYYNFSIQQKTYSDSRDCYVFRAAVKPNYRPNKTIIKYLETYFDKETFQVVARNYHLKYDGLFDFDVKMKVNLTQVDEKYLPQSVFYDGQWKIPAKKREVVQFKIDFEY
ncbi:MAG: hypothetical protein AAF960_22160 [Bacteroidota bacterium]